jgi:hypothetical protein
MRALKPLAFLSAFNLCGSSFDAPLRASLPVLTRLITSMAVVIAELKVVPSWAERLSLRTGAAVVDLADQR